MERILSSRQTPAIAIAVLALVVAATGVAVAVPGATISKVTAAKVRLIARQVADAEIAAKTKGIADSEISARAPGLTVGNAERLGNIASAGYQQRLRAAVIQVTPSTFTASVVSGNATGAGRLGNGDFYADFPADVRGCTPVASMTDAEPGYATARIYSSGDPNAVEVRTYPYNSTGSSVDPPDGYTFNVVVVC